MFKTSAFVVNLLSLIYFIYESVIFLIIAQFAMLPKCSNKVPLRLIGDLHVIFTPSDA